MCLPTISLEMLNEDVLELIFRFLDFRSLCAAEETCKMWKRVIDERRLYWQLSKRLCRHKLPILCSKRRKIEAKKNAAYYKRHKL